MSRERMHDKWDEAGRTGEPVLVGDLVVCDVCNRDWTHSKRSGGFIFGSYGYCPICSIAEITTIRKYGEERYIVARCPKGTSFADFVRSHRGENAFIQMRSL